MMSVYFRMDKQEVERRTQWDQIHAKHKTMKVKALFHVPWSSYSITCQTKQWRQLMYSSWKSTWTKFETSLISPTWCISKVKALSSNQHSYALSHLLKYSHSSNMQIQIVKLPKLNSTTKVQEVTQSSRLKSHSLMLMVNKIIRLYH